MTHESLDYESPHKPAEAEWIGPVACVIGAAATLMPLLRLYPMVTVASGTSIRPMDETLWMIVGAGAGVAIVLPMALLSIGVSLYKRQKVRWGLWAFAMAILSVVLPFSVFNLILNIRGLTLAD